MTGDDFARAAADWRAERAKGERGPAKPSFPPIDIPHLDKPKRRANGAAAAFNVWNAGRVVGLPPPRGWLLGNAFCRKLISSLLGDGGVGKSALRYLQAISLASGRELTGEHIFGRTRVLIVSLEDDDDEARRRILAAHRAGWLVVRRRARPQRRQTAHRRP